LQISGNNKVIAKNGFYTFSNLKFVKAPNVTSTIKFTSSSLDSKKIALLTPSNKQKGKNMINSNL
jgi:hypothetical protein